MGRSRWKKKTAWTICRCGRRFSDATQQRHYATLGHKRGINLDEMYQRNYRRVNRTAAKLLEDCDVRVHWEQTGSGYEYVQEVNKLVNILINEPWVSSKPHQAFNLTACLGLRKKQRVIAIKAILNDPEILDAYDAYVKLNAQASREIANGDKSYLRKFWLGIAKTQK